MSRLSNCQKLSKLSKIVKMLVRSCFLITVIKYLKGHWSLGSLFNVKKQKWVTHSVSQWQGHLLSCQVTAKKFTILVQPFSSKPPSFCPICHLWTNALNLGKWCFVFCFVCSSPQEFQTLSLLFQFCPILTHFCEICVQFCEICVQFCKICVRFFVKYVSILF